jgi:glycine N-methyltransferase
MLAGVFAPTAKSTIYGDFKPLNQIEDPAFYIHVVEKPAK